VLGPSHKAAQNGFQGYPQGTKLCHGGRRACNGPPQTNGYFLYATLEVLQVLKEFSKVKWRRHKEFGHNMLGFVFKNSVRRLCLTLAPIQFLS
jgi:hypothetical protein